MKKIFAMFLICFLMPVFAYAATLTVTVTTDKASFSAGQVVTTTAVFKKSGVLYSTSTPAKITIRNPSGSTLVNAVSMTKVSTGTYTYNYTLAGTAPVGTWTDSCSLTAGSDSGTGSTTFAVAVPVHPTLTWTGYNMCRTCHVQQATDMFNSVHYQWRGPTSTTTGPATQGKFSPTVDNSTAINAYCINILGNWNTYSGCSNCHVGLGVQPTITADAAQLDNIDCLLCHQKDYKRSRPITGGLYTPNTALMTITMDQAVQTITKPTRSTCLQCHAKGGGGDNIKRGDMALAQGATTDSSFDVHMATTRGNLACQACHATTSHKMAGRGTDLRPKEAAAIISCSTTTCHPTKGGLTSGHTTSDVNHHTGRVACQACHIKTYAKDAADTVANEQTEIFRTWKTSEWNATLNRYEPTITKAGNLMPKYAFWNGTNWGSNLLDTPVLDAATGAYKLSRPNGAINDAVGTKLYPFKYKTSEVPFNTGRSTLISVDTGLYFTNGLVDGAVNQGMVNMGYSAGEAYSWVKTDEFQLITHEVPTAIGNVLACADCHKNTTRINLPAMGYTIKAPTSTICVQCHGSKTYSDYKWVHDFHVKGKGYDCSFCHSFSRAAERGLKTTK